MKEFKKNKQQHFICEECNRTFVKKDGLSKHVRLVHHGQKIYYDKWLKENNEGYCKICGNETIFVGFKNGYKKCCCKKCSINYTHKQIIKANLKLYGVENVFQSEKIKQKIKQTCIKKYGVEYSLQNLKIRQKGNQTKKEKYGNENYHNLEKSKLTCLNKYGHENFAHGTNQQKVKDTMMYRYGVENAFQSKNIQEKYKNTCLKKYGVENPSQNSIIYEKQQKAGFCAKKYNTNIFYRGQNEFDFLEKYYLMFSDMINAKPIKYFFENKSHIYFPDFYISKLNLIIEIKSSYYYEKFKQKCDAKQNAVLASGFNYIMIIDKDYTLFESLLNK